MRKILTKFSFSNKNSPKFILENGQYLSRNVKTFLEEHSDNLKKMELDIEKKIELQSASKQLDLSDLNESHESFLDEFHIKKQAEP